jgi:hypothetical protein
MSELPIIIAPDHTKIVSSAGRQKYAVWHESAAREEIRRLTAERETRPEFQRPHWDSKIARLQAALDAFAPGTVADARRRVSTLHPDHGGPGGVPYQQAMAQLRKAKEKSA